MTSGLLWVLPAGGLWLARVKRTVIVMQLYRSLRRVAARLRDAALAVAFRIFDRLLPVKDDYWCFCTWSGYGHTLDNPRAVFEAMRDMPHITRVILLRSEIEAATAEPDNVRFVFCESLRGAYYLARSRVVFLGYSMPAIASYARWLTAPRHKIIFLGHGVTGLKKVGHFDGGDRDWTEETRHFAATICSSTEEGELLSKAFAPVPTCWNTGLPRNDIILSESDALPVDYRAFRASFDDRVGNRRVVLYAPTWRLGFSAPYVFDKEEVRSLTSLLTHHDAVLAIHGHPNADWKKLFRQMPSSDRILSVRDIPDINIILPRADVLITDYSSVFLDFLLLDRPIIHFAYDLELHRSHDRFFGDPESIFAGTCAQTFSQLMNALNEALSAGDREQRLRASVRDRFHQHRSHCARQVVSHVEQLLTND